MDLQITSKSNGLDLDYHNYPPHIFEHSYVTGVLGIKLPLTEAAPYSTHYRRLIIEEHLLLEGFFDGLKKLKDDALMFGKALKDIFKNPETMSIVEASGHIYEGTKITRWLY